MLNVGLTGGIGAGKSEVTRRFAALGAEVVDADAIAHEVVEPGTVGLASIVAEFGPEMLSTDGCLDRELLGTIVFSDPDARTRLNAIVHPLVGQRVADLVTQIGQRDPHAVVVHDVPLIVEAAIRDRYDLVVVVDAPVEVQVERLTRLRGMTEDAARARIGAQASRAERAEIAEYVIVNDGDLDALDEQVEVVWRALCARAGR